MEKSTGPRAKRGVPKGPKGIAQGLRAEINAMLAFLPNLRLAQNQWLASERETLNRLRGEAFVSKVSKFISSPEFALENMRSKLSETDRSLNCILAHGVSLHQEALCWARANLLLTDRSTMNDALTVLVENNVISLGPEVAKQLDLSESTDDRWMLFFSWGRAIQERIVIPLLDRSE
jgi:hypothetical protein